MTRSTQKLSNFQWATGKYTFVTKGGNNDTHLLLGMGMQCVDLPLFPERDYCREGPDPQ